MMGPPPGPDPALQALEGLSGVPSPQREQKAMAEATAQLQIAVQGVYGRDATAAKHLLKAMELIQQARESLDKLAQQAVGPPPDLLGGMSPAPMGPPSPMM